VEWCFSDTKDLKKVAIIAGYHLGEAVLAELEVAQQSYLQGSHGKVFCLCH
jgi:hypothetical protein